MKTLYTFFAGIIVLLVASLVELHADESNEGSSRFIKPCTSWTYVFDSRGYVCQFYDQIEAVERRDLMDLQNQIRSLQTKIQSLESRVSALEQE